MGEELTKNIWGDFMENIRQEKIHKQLNLPKANAAKKKKFLEAIGATSQLDESTTNANIDDENAHLIGITKFMSIFSTELWSKPSRPFDDSVVVNGFQNIKKPEFDLKTYISCVKELYHDTLLPYTCMCYLLCHARDFTVPRNSLFRFSENGTEEINCKPTDANLTVASPSPFTAKLITLMEDLLVKYSEAKYQQLNLNVTYLVLVLTRKYFKGNSSYANALKKQKTHEDYLKLCRKPLSEKLPDDPPLLKNEAFRTGDTLFMLVLYAYQESAKLTRRVLVNTCIAQMEYTGLGLPRMFDKLVELYRVPEAKVWDAFCVYEYESLFKLADFHDTQRKGEEEIPPKTYCLFPYCRVLNQQYHSDLACKDHKIMCYAMACLIDKKIGTDKSFLVEAHWAKDFKNTPMCNKAKALADAVYEVINAYDGCGGGRGAGDGDGGTDDQQTSLDSRHSPVLS